MQTMLQKKKPNRSFNIANIPSFLEPPGCRSEGFNHPSRNGTVIKLALFQEHRFAFYYWLKWTQKLNGVIPSLITFDWHQDLCPPYKDQIPELKKLRIDDPVEVALYTWGKLSHDNDVQIHAALKHNMLKDIYVICRQDANRKPIDTLKDFKGSIHKIHIFKSVDDFVKYLPSISDEQVYLDIDLDYFTLSNPLSMSNPFPEKHFTFMKKKEIVDMLSVDNPMIEWIFKRLAGITIATEPEFCGGLKQSNYFLNIIDELYFTPSLFHNIPGSSNGYTKWRHINF
ncbi:MAG: hypothetical protein BGO69_09130 [Bacteroidetes bacterium 46-16]|nr:MAG: hypothetical protein BGO69_09130 [Bacteroidetes bacterium 46-16]